MIVLTLVLLLVLLAMALGHDRFSSQLLWTTQKGTEGALATSLAENAVEEARFEIGRRVNNPADPLFDYFRGGQGRRPVDGLAVNDPGKSQTRKLLAEETYKRFNFEGEPAEVEIYSQEPFGPFNFETRGLLRYFTSVAGYPLRRPTDKLVRQVEVRQEFKVALIGPPSPFDRMTLYVHNGHEFLGLDSPDEWANTTKLLKKLRAEIVRAERERDRYKQKLLDNAGNKEYMPGYDAVMADLNAIPFDGLRKIEKYEQAYGREFVFPEPPMALVALAATGKGFNLGELASDAWVRQEAEWRRRKTTADTEEVALRRFESSNTWAPAAIRRGIRALRALSDFDQEFIMKRVYPLYFAGCRLDSKPRLVYNVIGADPAPGGGSAIEHYRGLLATFSRDQTSWRQKFFYRVRRDSAGSIDEALAKFRRQQDPVNGVLNGVVYVDNPGETLHLTEPIPGKLVLIVEGDIQLTNLPKADDRSLLTVISYGTMTVEGEVWACLIPRGSFAPSAGSGPSIRGSLILDESYHWTGRAPRLRGDVFPDLTLVSSAEPQPGKVAIFPDRQMVVLSPATESRVVNRTGN